MLCFLGMDVDSIDDSEKRGLTKKKLTLAFDEYKRITNMLVVYMRSEEEKRIAGMYLNIIFCFVFINRIKVKSHAYSNITH